MGLNCTEIKSDAHLCQLEIYSNAERRWRALGSIEIVPGSAGQLGIADANQIYSQDLDYVIEAYRQKRSPEWMRGIGAASVREALNAGAVSSYGSWLPFALDLIPAGAARRTWKRILGLGHGEARADWEIFRSGAGNPPGNLRVAPLPEHSMSESCKGPLAPIGRAQFRALQRGPEWHARGQAAQPGFALEDILKRGADWIDYAERLGIPVSGASGAQGEAPKYLLRQDLEGSYHADLELPDHLTKRCVIVKFPRQDTPQDRMIIAAEHRYLQIARELGLSIGREIALVSGALIDERFDRVMKAGGLVERLGLESLCSAIGEASFSAPLPQEDLLAVVAKESSAPEADIVEFLCRDILNLLLGNTDNYARNTAFLKTEDGAVRLSPLFDFAPMALDASGIARVCRFSSEYAEGNASGLPDWLLEIDALAQRQAELYGKRPRPWGRPTRALNRNIQVKGFDVEACKQRVLAFMRSVVAIEVLLERFGLPEGVIRGTENTRSRTRARLLQLLEKHGG